MHLIRERCSHISLESARAMHDAVLFYCSPAEKAETHRELRGSSGFTLFCFIREMYEKYD